MLESDGVSMEPSPQNEEPRTVPDRSNREHLYCLSIQAVALLGIVIAIKGVFPPGGLLSSRYFRSFNWAYSVAGIAVLLFPLVLFLCSKRLARRFAPVCEQDFDDSSSLFLLTMFTRCAGIYFLLEFAFGMCRQAAIILVVLQNDEFRGQLSQLQADNYVTMFLPSAFWLFVALVATFGAEKVAWILNRKYALSTMESTEDTIALLLPRFCQVACAFYGVSLIIKSLWPLMSRLLNTHQTNNLGLYSTVMKIVIGVIFIVGHRRLYSLLIKLRQARVRAED